MLLIGELLREWQAYRVAETCANRTPLRFGTWLLTVWKVAK